ncbi:PEGA domain-containing protein [Halorhodospira halochloris]|uniref:PEGA domain-containing protein n=1 Tax=Halorhodospira halochloris TaxID=1052 RepID=UPI001EE823D2|nr:PEGA domain-containing protein [Halorhodospira halochloris]MCG5531603.1 PEGA domain-containing protein [Halorhodospira halochloris]
MNIKKILIAAALASVVTGCASIMHGTTQDVGISSSPSNATVWANGQQLGKTPLTTKLARKENHIIKIELPGYLPYETTFTRSVSGWVWGNIVFGGLIGLAVDAISGGLYKLTPEQINAELRSENLGSTFSEDGVLVFVVLQPDPSWQQVGSLTKVN